MAGRGSFDEFYAGAVGRLVGQLYPVTGDLHEAEEVVQEAFTRAATRWQRLRDYDRPEAWVRRVAMSHLVDPQVEEIAQTLGMPEGTVKSLLSRGRHALAPKLGETEEVLDPS